MPEREAARLPVPAPPPPGELAAVAAGDRTIAVANVDGVLYAFQDACTHEECPLSEGDLEGHIVVCDCHGGQFDVRTGEAVDGPVYEPLVTYPVVATDDGAAIDLDAADPVQ